MHPGDPDDVLRAMTGEPVTELQKFLSAQGYTVATSGTFGEDTESALWNFGESTGKSYDSMLDIVTDAQARGELSGDYQYAEEPHQYRNAGQEEPDQHFYSQLAPSGEYSDDEYSDDEDGDDEDHGVTGAPEPVYEHQAQNRMPAYDNYQGTYYPSTEQASTYNVGVAGGRVIKTDADGNPIRDDKGNPVYADTTNVVTQHLMAGSKPERMIYTMDGEGDLRMADPQAEMQRRGQRFHHSSLARGEAVSGAGEMKVREGTVEAVSDKSGHYQPDLAMTAQVDQRLQASGVDSSRVTYELGNYGKSGGGQADPDTLVSGTELGAYDREGILADIRSRFWQEAEEGAKAGLGKNWDRVNPAIKQGEIQKRYEQICAQRYGRFEAMDDRLLYAEARQIIEGRHDQQRAVLDDIRKATPAEWLQDPLKAGRLRWWDGSAWTANVSDGKETTQDPEGAAALSGKDADGQ